MNNPLVPEGFTPGPWKTITAQPGTMLEVVDETGEYVCSLLGAEECKQANAALLKAAPAMYEAIQAAIGMLGDLTGGTSETLTKADIWPIQTLLEDLLYPKG